MSEDVDPMQRTRTNITKILLIITTVCMGKIYYYTVLEQATQMIQWILIFMASVTAFTLMTPLPELIQPIPPLIQLQCLTCPHREETNPFAKCVLYGGLRVTLFSGGIFNRCRGR